MLPRLSTKGTGNDDTPVSIISPSTQILASEYHIPLRGTNTPWRNDGFQGWVRKRIR